MYKKFPYKLICLQKRLTNADYNRHITRTRHTTLHSLSPSGNNVWLRCTDWTDTGTLPPVLISQHEGKEHTDMDTHYIYSFNSSFKSHVLHNAVSWKLVYEKRTCTSFTFV